MSVTPPDEWSAQPVPKGLSDADYIATGPPGYGGYVPSVVVSHAIGVRTSLEEWADLTVRESAREIPTLRVLDVSSGVIAGHPSVVHLLTLTAANLSLTQLQFALLVGGGESAATGYTITTTSATADFPELAGTFFEIAISFDLEGAHA